MGIRPFPVVVFAAALALAAGSAFALVHVLIPGQKAFGSIGVADEEDFVQFQATEGTTVSFTLKARKGETLLPVFTKLLDPAQADVLGTTVLPKANKPGTKVKVRFIVPQTGTWTLAFTGASGSTGTWDMTSTGPRKIPLGNSLVANPDDEVLHEFEADVGTVAKLQAKAATGSPLRPLIDRVERPASAGALDLSAAKRTTTKRSDTISNLALPENGTWGVVVTGAEGTTGAYLLTLKVGRAIPLDFSVDPPPPPPPPAPGFGSVDPPTMAVPASGSQSRSITVNGTDFQNGASVAISAGAGTSGISNVATTFLNSSTLTVMFTLSSGATPGARDVTVTNPDLQSATGTGALTLEPPGFQVTGVSPNHGPGTGGTQVVVQGSSFASGATVTFGGVAALAVNVVDSGNIACVAPAAASVSSSAGTAVDVTVDNGGGDVSTLAGGFTYDADPTPPVVVGAIPADQATGVARNLQAYVFVLSEPVDPATVSSVAGFSFFGTPVNDVMAPPVANVSAGPGGRLVVIHRNATPAALLGNNGYRANIPTTVADPAGNPLDPRPFFGAGLWQGAFTTHATATDAAAPTITATTPAQAAPAADPSAPLTITFSEAVDPSTVAAAVGLSQGAVPVPFDLSLDASCTVATLVPNAKLASGAAHQLTVSVGLKDLCGNALATPFAAVFSTAAADTLAPVAVVTVDLLPGDQNGSGTYVPGTSNGGAPSAPGAPAAFNAYLPRSGFTIDVSFSDPGGSGVDVSTFQFTCSAAMGGTGPGIDLSSQFTVTPLGAHWTVDAGHALAAGTNIVFTAAASDVAGNAATPATLAVDVADITRTITNAVGTPTTDRNPFNARQSWLLRFDQDVWTITSSAVSPTYLTASHSKPISVNSTAGADGTPDFQQDLTLIGLNGPMTGTNASTVVNGSDTGTNAIVQTMVRKAVRGWMNLRYGIAYDGTRSADSVDVEFLLAGETKSGGGTVSPAGWTGASGFSMFSFTGDDRAVPPGTPGVGGTLGRAPFNLRNTIEEDVSNNSAAAAGFNVGAFGTHLIRLLIDDADALPFPATFDPLISLAGRGGTPVGSDNLDAVVLAANFDYAAANAARKARFDLITTAVNRYAMALSLTGAHEAGHAMGLVADGAPAPGSGGLFGNAHPNNTFVASAAFTTSGHIDTAGNNIMEAASSFDQGIAQGSEFTVFEPLCLSWLLRRFLYDQ
jgi:hypothetical protein